jgi:hypothetical protein
MSEWLDVMLEEIARKKAEAEDAKSEHENRDKDAGAADSRDTVTRNSA